MEEYMKLIISSKDNKVTLNTDEPIRIDDLMTILFTIQLQAMNQVKATTPEKHRQQVIEDLYDKYNAGASNLLYLFAPDQELHPDLTVEAMKEAEDKYLAKRGKTK